MGMDWSLREVRAFSGGAAPARLRCRLTRPAAGAWACSPASSQKQPAGRVSAPFWDATAARGTDGRPCYPWPARRPGLGAGGRPSGGSGASECPPTTTTTHTHTQHNAGLLVGGG